MNLPLARRVELDPPAAEQSGFDAGTGRGFLSGGRLVGLLGPAFVAAVAFVDPGNIAINVSAGADFRYLLLWTVITASLMAMVVQYLSAKLGMATGSSLAEVCRDNTVTPVRITLWLVAELVVIMTDLAEFVGGAIALNLLFGIPLLIGGLMMTAVTLFILRLRVNGRESFPSVVVALLAVLLVSLGYLILRSGLDPGAAVSGLAPHFRSSHSVLLGCGIIGATVMPHAVFLHSSLVSGLEGTGSQVRSIRTPAMLRFLRRDVIVAMSVAGLANVLILLVATTLPAGSGGSLADAHSAFARQEGAVFAAVFAIALLVSGLASACAGVYSGQAIMQGFLRRTSSIWVRRMVSSLPALLILGLVSDPSQALVLSQVVLSFGLPFALVPLIVFTTRRSVMGSFANKLPVTIAGLAITLIVLFLNGFLLVRVLAPS